MIKTTERSIIITQVVCDRCGGVIEDDENNLRLDATLNGYMPYGAGQRFKDLERRFDLCHGCMDKVWNCINDS